MHGYGDTASSPASFSGRLANTLRELMLIPGLSGHEGRVRCHIAERLIEAEVATRTDRIGNLIATLPGETSAPSVMLFAHMDQLGFFVRRIEQNGLIRLERLGGVPDRALPSTALRLCIGAGKDLAAVVASKSNHVVRESEKYKAESYFELYVDAGFESDEEARTAGVAVGTPIVYEPRCVRLGANRISGTAIDDRAGCAIVLEVARALKSRSGRPTLHVVFAVQEEFNVRGAALAAEALRPDIAIQLDTAIASDTPDLHGLGEISLGAGPAMSLYNLHGRGTLNGLIPHPALVAHFEGAAASLDLPLQRSALVGALTDGAYVQFAGEGVACIELGVPVRYAHAPNEVADLRDMERLAALLVAGIAAIGPDFSLDRDRYTS